MTTDIDVVIDEKIKITTNEPSKYNVIMLNDDATPMEWVIEILKLRCVSIMCKHFKQTVP